MSLTKKDRQLIESLRTDVAVAEWRAEIARALRWSGHLPVPDVREGWGWTPHVLNGNAEVRPVLLRGGSHNSGWARDTKWPTDNSMARGQPPTYSTRLHALLAARADLESQAATALANLDREITEERTNPREMQEPARPIHPKGNP